MRKEKVYFVVADYVFYNLRDAKKRQAELKSALGYAEDIYKFVGEKKVRLA